MPKSNFIERKRPATCPVCGHADRCKPHRQHGDDLILCFRVSDSEVNGYRLTKNTRGCACYVRIGSEADHNGKADHVPRPVARPLADRMQEYQRAATDDRVSDLAESLGVSTASLRAIGVGFQPLPCFPEHDPEGNVTAINVRHKDGSKRVGRGEHRGLIVPKNLHELPDPVLIVEGASDVAAALTMGTTAVGRPSNLGGADHLAKLLAVRECTVIGESDKKPGGSWPGRDGAVSVAQKLSASWSKPVPWALPPDGVKDVREYLRTIEEPAEAGRKLMAHVQETKAFVTFDTEPIKVSPDSWPDPEPLPDALPPVAAFDPALLPEAFRPWVADISERTQTPPDFCAVSAMVALSAVVGRRISIRPKQHDDWTVIPNLWGAAIARTGVLLKSPMMREATTPLRRLEIEAKKEFERESRERAAMGLVDAVRRKEAEKGIREALRNNEDAAGLAREIVERTESPAPVRRRYITNDSTVEKLGEILNENPTGILYFRDELIGFLRTLERDGYEGARAFYLEAWNGNGRYAFDRIGRGIIDIDSTTVSILGGIQPSVLHEYLSWSLREIGSDGLMQRFQLAVWPDVPRGWVNVDRWPKTDAKNTAFAVFAQAIQLDARAMGADFDFDDPEAIPYLRFSNEAQSVFNDWHSRLEHRLRSGDLHQAIEEHLAKFRSLVPSLALLIHVADAGIGPVGIGPLSRAIGWGDYLESHARRIYSAVVAPDVAAATALAGKLRNGALRDGFSLRDVYRKHWSGLTDRDDVTVGLELLTELCWLHPVREDTDGRPTTTYLVNPRILNPPG